MTGTPNRTTIQQAASDCRRLIKAHQFTKGKAPEKLTVSRAMWSVLEFSARNNYTRGRFMFGINVAGLHQDPDGRLFLDGVELVTT